MADPTITLQAPPRRDPREGGLDSSVAEFRDESRLAAAAGVQYDPDVCAPAYAEVQLCYGPDVDAADKEPAWLPDAAVGIGPNFGGYLGIECYLGQTQDEYGPRARRALELAQNLVVEEALWTWLVAGTGAAATSLTKAIAAADAAADLGYVGRPVIHLNRGDAVEATAAGALLRLDGRLVTPNGSPVVASAKYAVGTVVASGGITVVQSPIEVHEGLSLGTNRFMAIAERVYNIAVDCGFRAEFTVS